MSRREPDGNSQLRQWHLNLDTPVGLMHHPLWVKYMSFPVFVCFKLWNTYSFPTLLPFSPVTRYSCPLMSFYKSILNPSSSWFSTRCLSASEHANFISMILFQSECSPFCLIKKKSFTILTLTFIFFQSLHSYATYHIIFFKKMTGWIWNLEYYVVSKLKRSVTVKIYLAPIKDGLTVI